jgi:tRNA-modifying protein YgfZ
MSIAHLHERGVLKLGGDDARGFLDGLVTCDMDAVTPERAGYGALLTPQGKVIVDFLIIALTDEDGGGFLIDCPLALSGDLAKRLGLYKLRAKVTIEDLSPHAGVIAVTDGGLISPDLGVVFADPRYDALGDRAIVDQAEIASLATASADDYHARRIVLGVPDGGKDFAYGGQQTFPHEAMLDQLGGVSFTKGCFVGQEVVSRMQHRGTARTRLVPVRFVDGLRSEWGVAIRAGDKSLGFIGSTARDRGLAMVRLDRWADAMALGEPVLAGGIEIALEKPPFVTFPFPGEIGFGGGELA